MISLAWGVACFVILYSYGEGFGFALRASFQAVGQDLVVMFPGQTSNQTGGERSGRAIKLDLADAALIRDNIPLVTGVSAELMLRDATVGTRLSPAEHVRAWRGTTLRQGSQHDDEFRPLVLPRGLSE